MAGLLDIDMTTPEGQGFNSALMQAAAMLLTPRHRGGGIGSAFAAMPQAIEQAKAQAMRGRLLGLQEQQLGLQGRKLGFDMQQAQLGQQQAAAAQAELDGLIRGLPANEQPIARALGRDYFKGLAPQAQKPPEPTQLSRLIAERDKLPEGHPMRVVYDQAINKSTSHAPAASISNFVMPATPGQEAADKKFAGDFIDFATGGYADVQKQLDQLREASAALASGRTISGPLIGNLPDSVLAATNPQAVATKEAIQEVAQRNLRVILGAQFTEKEGERLIARVFNPRLGEAENKKRVDRLIRQIETAAQAKLDAAQYFQQHGSLTGWKGRMPRLSDFEPDFVKKEPEAPSVDDLLKKYGQ